MLKVKTTATTFLCADCAELIYIYDEIIEQERKLHHILDDEFATVGLVRSLSKTLHSFVQFENYGFRSDHILFCHHTVLNKSQLHL